MTDYAFTTDIDVHLRDVDRGNHVNNAVMVAYLQQARIEYLETLVDYDPDEVFVVVAALEIEYERPVGWGETVTVDLRVTELGTSSFTMEYRVRVGDERAATAETRMVTYDRDAETSVAVPAGWRERLVEDNERWLAGDSSA